MFLFLLLSAGAGIGIAGGVTGGAASISEKVVNSKQMKVAKEALISDQESTLELQSQIEALRLPSRGVFRTSELRVLTVIDCPKIAGAKGLTVIDFPILRVLKHP